MANSKSGEASPVHGKEEKGAKCCSTKTEGTTRVKVQWPKSCSKVFPSCRTTTQSPTQPANNCDKKEESKQESENLHNITKQQEDESRTTQKPPHEQESCSECCQQDSATVARLRAQRRWRMGLLKRSKFGGIGEADVSDLFPDYFPSAFSLEEGSEDDDILTSLKESKQRHRAKLLKQNSIDKIDRELGDRETKLIAGSWLQIYS